MANLTDIRSSWSTGASEGGVNVYATKEDLPTSGLTSGDQAYVTGNSRFYISNGSGWYNVALVNATPALTISPTGVIELSTEGTATTITLTATDSDNAVAGLSYSVESDGSFAGLASISQDSSVFTITPLSEDSATTTSAVLTFKASDGISFGTGDRTLTLSFKVANSNYTTLLLKNEETTDNQVDASTNTHTITENGNVKSTALTPYHPGGYSTYFDGNGDYLSVAYNSNLDLTQSSTTTIEAWIYLPAAPDGNKSIITNRPVGVPDEGMDLRLTSSRTIQYYETGAGSVSGSTVISLNTWSHVAVIKTGGNVYIYINGTLDNSGSAPNGTAGTNPTFIGRNGGDGTQYINAYIKDVRVVNGTAVYTSAFTPPTAPLTAIANTSLLACHLPYIVDGSSNGHAITVNGDTKTERFGPYDYLGYAKADHGGSVYFDGSGDYLSIVDDNMTSTGEFTVEGWFYSTSAVGQVIFHWSDISDGNDNDLILGNDGSITCRVGSGGNTLTSSSTGLWKVNIWHHFAVVRNSSNNVDVYLDGKHIIDHGVRTDDMDNTLEIGRNPYGGGGSYFIGYLSNFRVVDGTAVYTSAFTPPTAPLTAITNTQLLTCTNKNDIWDASSGNLLTKAGDVTGGGNSGTLKFGQTAVYLDGNGDYISAPTSDIFDLAGSVVWTIEGWFYWSSLSGEQTLVEKFTGGTGPGWTLYKLNTSNAIGFYSGSSATFSNAIGTVTSGQWYHVALTRDAAGTVRGFLDGTLNASGTYSIGNNSTGNLYIGARNGSANYMNGYVQDLRITKGLARYTANFTPPTAEFDG